MDFTLPKPNPYHHVTDAMWWFWCKLHEHDPKIELGGIYANKKGFHNTGAANEKYWPGNYSIRDYPNRTGPWWRDYASAIDLTFPEAQKGDYSRIATYSQRLIKSGKDNNDPRLGMVLYEFFGQADRDSYVEGYNEYREENASSDPSHLWHIHLEIFRNKCGDFHALYALLTVMMGWTVQQWRDSLMEDSVFCRYNPKAKSMAVEYLQLNLNQLGQQLEVDGFYGPLTAEAVADELGAVAGDGKNYAAAQHKALMDKLYGPRTQNPVQYPETVSFTLPSHTVQVDVEWKYGN